MSEIRIDTPASLGLSDDDVRKADGSFSKRGGRHDKQHAGIDRSAGEAADGRAVAAPELDKRGRSGRRGQIARSAI